MLLPYSDLEWSTFDCVFEFLEPAFFDEFLGAVLRSALGYALRNVSDLESYRYMFETPPTRPLPERKYSAIPRPFVLYTSSQGQTWAATAESFHLYLTLIGKGISYLPYFMEAFHLMGQRGIGLKRSKFVLAKVESLGLNAERQTTYIEDGSLYDWDIFRITLDEFRGRPEFQPTEMLLSFLTPLRMKARGVFVTPKDFELDTYLRRLVERVRALGYFYNGMPWFDMDGSLIAQAQRISCESRLHWQEWEFYVNKRRQKLGGLVGQVILRGDLLPFCSTLEIAQWLQVGKNTSYGFGAVAIQY